MRGLLRLTALTTAVALLGYGLLTGSDYVFSETESLPPGYDNVWLITLYAAALPLGYLLFSLIPRHATGWRRSAWKVAATLVLGFVLISLQLLRQQFVMGPVLANRPVTTAGSPPSYTNPRVVEAELRIQRGRVFDRDGVELAGREVGANGYVKRTYPEPLAGYLVGYYAPGLYGRSALERKYDDYLTGRQGDPVEEARSRLLRRSTVGSDLRLTLDMDLQRLGHELLGERRGSIIVMNPKTGEVLAMVSNPAYNAAELTFDPQKSRDEETKRIRSVYTALTDDAEGARLVNRAIQGRYSPGSTFKTVTATGALDTGTTTPDTIYEDNGTFKVGNFVVKDFRLPEPKTRYTFSEGYGYSLNVVLAKVGLQLKSAPLREYATRFGFEAPIPFDLPVRASQLENEPGSLSDPVNLAVTSFGQGQVLVTPLQMMQTAAAVANGGELPRPYLVSEIRTPAGRVAFRQDPQVLRRVMKPETAATMTQIMTRAVERGTVRRAGIQGVAVAGKTGTAQVGEGQEPHAWFTGFAPANDPQVAVAVLVENGGQGAAVAAPMAREIFLAALKGE